MQQRPKGNDRDDPSFYANRWPDAIFESTEFLYAPSYVQAASKVAGSDVYQLMISDGAAVDGTAKPVLGGGLLLTGKARVVEFERHFGQHLREHARSIANAHATSMLYMGGCTFSEFRDLRAKARTGLHIWSPKRALYRASESFSIRSEFDRAPDECLVNVFTAARSSFSENYDIRDAIRCHVVSDDDLLCRISSVAVSPRQLSMQLRLDDIDEMSFYALLTLFTDSLFEHACIKEMRFSR